MEMQKLAAEKMRSLRQQIEKVDRWVAEEALTNGAGADGSAGLGMTEGEERALGGRPPRALSLVLDAAGDLDHHKAAFEGGDGGGFTGLRGMTAKSR